MNLWRMVIPLVTLRLLFLLQLSSALAVDMTGCDSCGSAIVLPEQIFQPVHQPGSRQQHRGVTIAADVINQILCINIALRRRQPQPVKALFLVTGNITVIEKQLTESILCKLISLFSGYGQPVNGSFHILWNILTKKIELAELVSGIFIFLFCR